ncbi:MAG: hypothetical protein RL329_361 [Bacteroidota bacterium]|jgi:hypothetical protein
MLVTQQNNLPNQQLYGSYVIGRSWYFVLLEGNTYAVSRAYDATQADIFVIVALLKKIKAWIELSFFNSKIMDAF